ncbi:MAG TPA: Asd/ArgC dimerization domain-containing protein [Acidobacteriaceae bacterium]|nr:Asd/ArgC dimerization domain-containing protein [Acidobacteriaceae bacterium]
MTNQEKIAIVGAGSLRGRELNDALSDSPFGEAELLLMDDEAEMGTLEAVGDEVTFIQRIEPSSFRHAAFAFFAGDETLTKKHWQAALRSGASIVDLSGALEGEKGVLVRAPWIEDGEAPAAPNQPGLETRAVVPAHPVAVALTLLLARATELGGIRSASATVLEPASEYGRAAMDELHQQTVKLLSFTDLPKQVYDTQVAFNVTPVFGEAARFSLAASESRIRRHCALLSAGRLPESGVQLLHAPVFHGYGISLAVELERATTVDPMEAALAGEHVEIVTAESDPPTNLSVAGQAHILVRVRPLSGGAAAETNRFWIWAGFDNLRMAALNAVACALELNRLRPQGKVQ